MTKPIRGEIYYVNLEETVGSEEYGRRLCVIVQNDTGNHFSNITTVVPMTYSRKKDIPIHMDYKLFGRKLTVLSEQIRTISNIRLEECIGKISGSKLELLNQKLKLSLGMTDEEERYTPRIQDIQRGEIYYVDFSPVIGSEQGGIRPCVIIQNNCGNRYSPTTIVAPITSRVKKELPTHLNINCRFLSKDKSTIMFEQIRTIDKERLLDCLGKLDSNDIKKMNEKIRISLGIDEEV